MRNYFRLVSIGLALAVPCGVALWAADPTPARTSGRVLVLDNERTITGAIEREGDQYRVRRQAGETVVPAANVLFLCDTVEEAYAFLRSRSNPRDPDERVKLAHWCQFHNLHEQALAEARAAVELRPDRPEYERLLQVMQRTATPPAPAPPATTKPAAPAPVAAAPGVELSAEAMGLFVKKVQPILMNTCASCHMGGRGGAFKLVRALEGGMVSRKATQENLAVVLAQLNREKPGESPLLLRAVSVHGPASQPPLKGRQAPAFRTLDGWVRLVAAHGDAAKGGAAETNPVPPAGGSAFGTPAAPPSPGKAAPAAAVDPFDPAVFNRQKKPAGK